jgi:hypothetical protein
VATGEGTQKVAKGRVLCDNERRFVVTTAAAGAIGSGWEISREEEENNRQTEQCRLRKLYDEEFPVSSPEFRGEAPHVSLRQTHSINFLQEYDDQETDHIRQIWVGPDCIQIAAAGMLR